MVKKASAPAAAPAEQVLGAPAQPQAEQQPAEQQPAERAAPEEPAPVLAVAAAVESESAAAPADQVLVKARVLVACAHGQPDDVVELSADLAKTLVDVVDTDPAAVKYAESLK